MGKARRLKMRSAAAAAPSGSMLSAAIGLDDVTNATIRIGKFNSSGSVARVQNSRDVDIQVDQVNRPENYEILGD